MLTESESELDCISDRMELTVINRNMLLSQDNVFAFRNPRVACHSLPHIDLTRWKETPQGCQIGGRSVAVGDSGFPTPCTSCVCTTEGVRHFVFPTM